MWPLTPKISCTTTTPPRAAPAGAASYACNRCPSAAVSCIMRPTVRRLFPGDLRDRVQQRRRLGALVRLADQNVGRQHFALGAVELTVEIGIRVDDCAVEVQ